jgi:hypothetical protein
MTSDRPTPISTPRAVRSIRSRRPVLDGAGQPRAEPRWAVLERGRPVDHGRRIPLRRGGLLVQRRGALGPHLVAPIKAEHRERATRLDDGTASGQAPLQWGSLDDGAVGMAGVHRPEPSRAGRRAAGHGGDAHTGLVVVDLDHAMAFLATPGDQAAEQIGVFPAHRDLLSGSPAGEAEAHEHMGPAIEPDRVELDDGTLFDHEG